MPSKKKSHKKLLLSLVIATTIPGAHAASGWDCTQTSEGWSCSAAEPLAAQSTSTTSSEPSPTTALTVSDSSLPEASKAAAVKAPETLEPQSEPESMPVTLIKSEVDKQDAVPSETKNDYVAQAKLGESNKSADKVAMPVVTALPPQPTANIPDETVEHTIASSAHSVPSVSGSYMNLDWLHLSPIDAEGLVCKGVYREPEIWSEILTPGIAKSATTIDANRSSTVLGGLSELEGEVVIKQSGRQIESEYAQFDSKNRQALLRNNVRYREPGFLLRADTISADLDSSVAIANESSYVLHENELRGEALALTRYADRSIETQNSLITFCEPGNNDWAIRAQEMTLYPEEGFGESWHTRFEVAGVPVFYLPYFYFPLDDTRRSGFLYPSLSQDKENGFDLALPYYFNIAPNTDDTLTARLIEKRGLMLENEARYLNDFSMNQLSTGWMPSDDIYNQERWALSFDHRGNPAPGWGTHVDFTRVSDDDYFDDLAPVELRLPVKDDLNQSATVSYSASTWSASALVNDYQTIDGGSKPYARMPQLTLSGAETLGDTRLAYLGQYTDFTHETNTDGQRTHLRPTLTYDWNRTWGFLRPELGLWRSDYNLSNGTSPSATANFASLDSGLIFERQGELATQTLEPRIKLIHVGGDDTQSLQNFDSSGLGFSAGSLFDTLGYSGNDRVAHTDQATLGLTSRIFSLTGR
ncbi:MAG TPA: LPS assembly protein LptD, partial [Marinobacterium sp.]|nr:LPS assembly protein LptD [Marinobacterium sp.]